jgi:hypothetical protein
VTLKSIVLDANILIRSVLGNKVIALLEKFQMSARFITPEQCIEDACLYLPKIAEKKGLPVKSFDDKFLQAEKVIEVRDSWLSEDPMPVATGRCGVKPHQRLWSNWWGTQDPLILSRRQQEAMFSLFPVACP